MQIAGWPEICSCQAGPALLVKYDSDSEPNPVTNKILRLENDAYVFFKDGRVAILTVSAPRRADNDRIPLLQKTHYRNSGRRVCPLFSWA